MQDTTQADKVVLVITTVSLIEECVTTTLEPPWFLTQVFHRMYNSTGCGVVLFLVHSPGPGGVSV
jgi:hypothetical protein